MDWSLLIFISVALFFCYRGYKKGLLKSLARILSLLAGYVAAILYTRPLAEILDVRFDLAGLGGTVAAALSLFIGVGIIISLIFWIIDSLIISSDSKSTVSSVGGAGLGLITGLVVATIIVWTFAFVRDIRPDVINEVTSKPSGIENLANQLASKAVNTALSFGSTKPEIARLSAALIKSPAEITQQARRLGQSPDLLNLLNDPSNKPILDSGDTVALQNLPAFQQLTRNPDLLALANAAGMLDQSAGNTAAVEAELAAQLTDIWARSQRVKNNPRVQEILNDPEFRQKIQSGNPIDLLANPRLLELTDIIFSDEAAPAGSKLPQSANPENATSSAEPAKALSKIYSWTDKNGRIHYSDVEPNP